jgi:hypothetical protein
MRAAGKPPEDLLRDVWLALSAASRGRRPVALDPASIASRLPSRPDHSQVNAALSVLCERGILPPTTPDESVRLRVLASDLRLACEVPHLAPASKALLSAATSGGPAGAAWREIRLADLGVSAHQAQRAVLELESRQLVYAERRSPVVVVSDAHGERARLERCLSQLRMRRRAERLKLDAMVGYAVASTCRRAVILGYFGDVVPASYNCGDCDVCAP